MAPGICVDRLRPPGQVQWNKWELFFRPDYPVDAVRLEDVDRFRTAMKRQGKAVNQIARVIDVAKIVFRWAELRELVTANRIPAYRFQFGKDEKKLSPPEYTSEEFDAILAQLKPDHGPHWRAWPALTLIGHQGVRVKSARHLTCDDVDMDGGVLIWRAAYDKQGRECRQPMRAETRKALGVARE